MIGPYHALIIFPTGIVFTVFQLPHDTRDSGMIRHVGDLSVQSAHVVSFTVIVCVHFFLYSGTLYVLAADLLLSNLIQHINSEIFNNTEIIKGLDFKAGPTLKPFTFDILMW